MYEFRRRLEDPRRTGRGPSLGLRPFALPWRDHSGFFGSKGYKANRERGKGGEDGKAKGKAKEAAGAITGNEDKNAEGQAQQSKGEAREEVA